MPELVVWVSLWGNSLPYVMGEAEQHSRFSYALRAAMERREMSGRALAGILGIDPRRVTGWRNGVRLPNLYEGQAIAAALRVDEDLFRNPPEVPPPPPEPFYPIERYLLDAAGAGHAEGRRRASKDPAGGAPDTPPRKPARRPRGSGAGRG